MKRQEFERRLFEVLGKAAESASRFASREFAIPQRAMLHGAGAPGRVLSIGEVLDHLYLGEDTSYALIDVGVIADGPQSGLGWIVASGHQPQPDDRIWDADGTGPFKLIEWVLPPGSKLRPPVVGG
jgi:hypothetical protein